MIALDPQSMFRNLLRFCPIAGLALASGPAHASAAFGTGFTGTASEVFSQTQFAYAADVSSSDLLHGITPMVTLANWNTNNNAHPNELTDGIHGVGFNVIATDKVQGAWTKTNVSSATYNLGTGANGMGFNITSVQSIADWVNVGFGNQAWRIEVKPVGGSYRDLATVNFQPLGKVAPNDIGTSKVTLSSLDATGIESIRVTSDNVNGGSNSGAFVWRELDVFGAATGTMDQTPPDLSTLAPIPGATGVPASTNLVATFNEAVALGTGTISVQDLDTPANTVTIALPDGRVSVSGSVLTINLASNLSPTTDYAVRIGQGAIADLSGNPFVGIPDDTTWNFVTAPAPLRIMCIGDSITTGYTDNPSWANHPFKFGYRGPLYTRLSNAGYNFLFVGGSAEPWNNAYGDPSYGGTYTPALDLRALGQDGHRGYGGKAANYLNANILTWLASDDPDIILLKIGTNSQNQGDLNTLVSTITTTKPDAHLIIAQIMPKYAYQAGIVTYNSYIRDTLVPGFQAQGKNVTVVDQYAPFLTNPAVLTSIDQSLFSNANNHPDNDGYDKMAQVWFEGIEALGLGPDTFDHWIADPAFGIDPAKRGLDADADNDGIENGVENYFGTHPGSYSQGLVAGSKNGNTFTFTHPIGATLASDLEATYRWSKDLSTFTPSAAAYQGTTVTFTPGTPAGGFVTVTAAVTGTSLAKVFVDVEVTRK